MIQEPGDKPVDLFYTASRSDDDAFLDRIRSASAQAKIQLHIVRTATEGRLDANRICETVPEWREADVWFCGPTSFGESLRKELVSIGLPPNDFHYELFEMR